MAFGRRANAKIGSPESGSSDVVPKQRRTHWIRGAVMALAVAIGNLIYFALTGEALPSPRYGSATHGHEPNPGGAFMLTGAMLIFAGFCWAMHRMQIRKDQKAKK